MNMTKAARHISLLLLLIVLLLAANLLVGSVAIPAGEVLRILMGEDAGRESWHYIVWEARLPQALTALLAGSALAVCGLLLQTAFRNPLAGASVLGVNSGAGLGVAVVMLLLGGSITAAGFSFSGFFSILLGAFAGAMAVMALILFFSTLVRSHVMLLIIGLMVGYLVSSVVSLLNFLATAEGVQSYMVWGMGNFGGVSLRQMLLEAVEAHRRDIDLKLLRGILIESGQFLRFEHPLNQPERRADPPPGETVAGIAADAEQFRKQSQTAEHPEKSPIAVGDRKPGAPRFPQHSDRVEQRCSGVNRRNRRNDIANPGVDIIAADRRFEMKAPEKRRGPILQHTGTECGDAAVSLPAAQFRQCGGRSKTVNIRITVAADQHPVLGIPFGTHCISPCISLFTQRSTISL